MDDPTACRIVKTLQDKGLVESSPDPHHGRRVLINNTEAGGRLAPILDAIAEDLGRVLEAGLTPEERAGLRTSLIKVIGALACASPAVEAAEHACLDLIPLP
jgi:DNA-binding MarR family transcriptional regulator